jgi:hypothetical protein
MTKYAARLSGGRQHRYQSNRKLRNPDFLGGNRGVQIARAARLWQPPLRLMRAE